MKILIVDDEQSPREFFASLARNKGFADIDVAISSEEALTRVIRSQYDLITLDIRMSGLSGLEIIAMVRNMCPHAIIAVISGYIDAEMPQDVGGCVDLFLDKPVAPETFMALLDKVERICEAMDEIQSLSTIPVAKR